MTRYVDGPEIEVELLIRASAARIWEIVSDPGLPARFSEELVEAHWGEHPVGEPGPGSLIEGRNQLDSIGDWTTTSIVTTWVPERTFGWAVRDVEDSAARWRFELVARSGHTLLRQHFLIGPGASGVTRWIEADPDNEEAIIDARLTFQAENMMRTLEGVKDLAEGQAGR